MCGHLWLVQGRVLPLKGYPSVVVDVGNRCVRPMLLSEQISQEVDLDEVVVAVVGEMQDRGALALDWLGLTAREVVERTFLRSD